VKQLNYSKIKLQLQITFIGPFQKGIPIVVKGQSQKYNSL